MSAPFPNIYTHRRVAESGAKACDICYKLSTSVLITPDKKDFFFVCAVHLKDRYFCTPKVDEEALKAKREKQVEEEKERLKKEYEERQQKKKAAKEKAEKEKSKDKDKNGEKDKDKDKGEDQAKDEDKGKTKNSDEDKSDDDSTAEQEEPRVFELKSAFYQQRLMKKRQIENAKRQRERASQPGYFPSVPTDLPGR